LRELIKKNGTFFLSFCHFLRRNGGKDNDGVVVMGGFAEDIERYWFVIAYIPTIMALVVGVGYFIEKKLLIRKPSRPK